MRSCLDCHEPLFHNDNGMLECEDGDWYVICDCGFPNRLKPTIEQLNNLIEAIRNS